MESWAVNKRPSELPGVFSRWVAKTPQIARVHSAESRWGIPIRTLRLSDLD